MRSLPKRMLGQMGKVIDHHIRYALAVRGIDFSELEKGGVTQRNSEARTELFFEGERILVITHEHTVTEEPGIGPVSHDTLNFDHHGFPGPARKPPI